LEILDPARISYFLVIESFSFGNPPPLSPSLAEGGGGFRERGCAPLKHPAGMGR